MLNINGKTFMNIQEAVQWLLDNNALPYQSSANYVADTEIGLGTISNPSPAKVRIGSLILFADGKVATVNGLTSTAFIVGSQYVDLSNTAKYVVSATVDGAGDLIFTLSDGSTINAGLIKQISSFAISGTNLIAYYNDGTSTDCGPLFVGSLTLPADLTVTDDLTVGGDATFGQIANFNGNVVIASGKNLTVGGGASFQTANFYDVATFDDEAYFNNPVTINDNLAVDGDFSTSRDATINGDMSVAGALTVTGSINGEANPSVKPIYFHGITLFNPVTKNYFVCHILNNDPTPIDTTQKFVDWLDSINDKVNVGGSGIVLVSGIFYNMVKIEKDPNATPKYSVVYVSNTGYNSSPMSQPTNTFTDCEDDVNKIN